MFYLAGSASLFSVTDWILVEDEITFSSTNQVTFFLYIFNFFVLVFIYQEDFTFGFDLCCGPFYRQLKVLPDLHLHTSHSYVSFAFIDIFNSKYQTTSLHVYLPFFIIFLVIITEFEHSCFLALQILILEIKV